MIKKLIITRPTKSDIKSAYDVLEASITDAFEKEGLGYLKDDILNEIEYKKYLLKFSIDNTDADTCFLSRQGCGFSFDLYYD